jgi:hypothetical protein
LPEKFTRHLRAVDVFGFGDFWHSFLILAATQLLTPSLGVVQAAEEPLAAMLKACKGSD